MDYYYLGQVSWENSQALYHAAAYLGREALFILSPATPYVCLGYHQDARQEIDVDFARKMNIPVFRREVGGGAVYLDSGQLFYQLVLRKDRPDVPADKSEFYRKFLEPVVQTYREFGVAAEFKPVNDILANGRKISGNGAAEIEGMAILVGNFILDFNFELMSRVLKVPDEKFRDKVFKTLSDNLTTLKRETGKVPASADLAEALRQHYESLLGPFEMKTTVDEALLAKARERFALMNTPEWLFCNDLHRAQAIQVKIREGVCVLQKLVKLPGGLVRITATSQDGALSDVHISGDFFIYPQGVLRQLEEALEGVPLNVEDLAVVIQDFYAYHQVLILGISPQALAQVFIKPG